MRQARFSLDCMGMVAIFNLWIALNPVIVTVVVAWFWRRQLIRTSNTQGRFESNAWPESARQLEQLIAEFQKPA